MRYVNEFLENRIILVVILSWFIAQALKVVFPLFVDKKLDFRRFFGLGGMPSSHSSVVCGMATAIALAKGFYSAEFAISFVLAFIVMTDAMGVRRAAGKQAALLNRIVQDMMANGRMPTQEKLKELLGHSPFQVIMGALLGVLIAVLVML